VPVGATDGVVTVTTTEGGAAASATPFDVT
jgi:hypothetical protein